MRALECGELADRSFGLKRFAKEVFAMARNLTKARALLAELQSLARPAILAFVALPLLFWCVSNCKASELPPKRLPVLTTAHAVHGLTPEQASLGYPVRIRGTVTFYDPYQVGHRALFIADETGSVFVAPGLLPTPRLHAGSRVEVSGVTDPGGYSPIVASSAINVLPGSNPLPTARASTVSTLLTGSEDSRWVALRGIVRSAQVDGMHVVFTLATNDGTITATTDKEDGANYSALVDSEVIMRGDAAPLVNSRRQLTGMRLLFPGMKTLSIIAPAAPICFCFLCAASAASCNTLPTLPACIGFMSAAASPSHGLDKPSVSWTTPPGSVSRPPIPPRSARAT